MHLRLQLPGSEAEGIFRRGSVVTAQPFGVVKSLVLKVGQWPWRAVRAYAMTLFCLKLAFPLRPTAGSVG